MIEFGTWESGSAVKTIGLDMLSQGGGGAHIEDQRCIAEVAKTFTAPCRRALVPISSS